MPRASEARFCMPPESCEGNRFANPLRPTRSMTSATRLRRSSRGTFWISSAMPMFFSIVRQGSYALIDLRAGYDFDDRVSLSVNVNNVLDKNYYARISSSGRGNYYGTPRTVFATLRFTYP